jgi:D-3-phosphoglycerate dehydrogenase/C-terminal binding protein
MFRVVVTDFVTDDLQVERCILDGVARVEPLEAAREEDLIGRIDDADAVMMYHTVALTERSISRLKNCKLIVRCGVGVDNVDHAYAATRGIAVANVPDYGTEDVADSAIGMMLALTRGIHRLASILRDGRGSWSYAQAAPLRRLRGGTLGIVGLGRVGTAVALRAKAIGMDVLFFDPFKPDGYDKALGIRRAETLDELLGQSYVLTLHCPLTERTRRLINADTLARMPRGSYLVNTARGEVVDADAVADALANDHLAGAALDVLPVEPPNGTEPILRAWRDPAHPAHHRLILNPHAAFYSEEGLMDMRVSGATACRRALTGLEVRNLVNDPVGRARS